MSCLLLCEGINGPLHLMGLSPVGDYLLSKVGILCLTVSQSSVPT